MGMVIDRKSVLGNFLASLRVRDRELDLFYTCARVRYKVRDHSWITSFKVAETWNSKWRVTSDRPILAPTLYEHQKGAQWPKCKMTKAPPPVFFSPSFSFFHSWSQGLVIWCWCVSESPSHTLELSSLEVPSRVIPNIKVKYCCCQLAQTLEFHLEMKETASRGKAPPHICVHLYTLQRPLSLLVCWTLLMLYSVWKTFNSILKG